jgi:hypothetical protein
MRSQHHLKEGPTGMVKNTIPNTNAHPLEIELENLKEVKRQWKKHVLMPKVELIDEDWMDLEEKRRPNRGRKLVKKVQQEDVRNGTKNGHNVH